MAQMTSFFRAVGILFLVSLAASVGWAEDPWGYLFELNNHRVHQLRGDVVRIGRLAEADIVLRESRVSRRHAEIRRESNGVVLVDVGSTNGTRRNGDRIVPNREVTLVSGDLLFVGYEKLLYHETQAELWDDSLQHALLASFVRLKVPVLSDRKVSSLGRERIVPGVSYATVDQEVRAVKMTYPEDAVRELAFRPEEVAFVGDVGVNQGELRLSLWGLVRDGSVVSRRAAMSHLKHGELVVRLDAASPRESRTKFETDWAGDGIHFLFPLMGAVVELLPEERTIEASLQLTRSLVDKDDSTALRETIQASVMLHQHAPDDFEPPLLAAQAGARWVKLRFEELRGNVPEGERAEFALVLAASKTRLAKAMELDAEDKKLKIVEEELAEAKAILARVR